MTKEGIYNPCGGKVIKQLWHCGWPSSDGYPGAYPDRYLRYMRELIDQLSGPDYEDPILHLFSGTVDEGVTIDMNADVKPTHVLDLTEDSIPYNCGYFTVWMKFPDIRLLRKQSVLPDREGILEYYM